jgi:DNA-binding transcriptional regulator YhcF (GntR family)
MLQFNLSLPKYGLPPSAQIIQAVRQGMLAGQLDAGDAFPSVRQLSRELHLSPATVQKPSRR